MNTISANKKHISPITAHILKISAIITIYLLNSIISHALTVKNPREVFLLANPSIYSVNFTIIDPDMAFNYFIKAMAALCALTWAYDTINNNNKFKSRRFIMVFTSFVGLKLVFCIAILVFTILEKPQKQNSDIRLLWDVYIVWISNILLFAIWYWLIDNGKKPHFCFPIQCNEIRGWEQKDIEETKKWKPNLIDYWFLSFTTSTAFGPTDTFVLSRWGKMSMMIQASISLVVLLILAAHAVNILRY